MQGQAAVTSGENLRPYKAGQGEEYTLFLFWVFKIIFPFVFSCFFLY
jgi:hypothetical protein